MIKRVNENNSEDFNTLVLELVELLNRTFSDKGKWFKYFMKPFGNHCDGIIEHDNGTQIELYDEEDRGKPVITLVVVYPNGKSHFIDKFYRDDILDIADKIYEYVVVKNPVKQEGKKMIRRKRVIEAEEYSVNTSSIFEDIESFEDYIEGLKKLANRMRGCVISYDRGDNNEDSFSKQMSYLVYKVKESLSRITSLVDGINDQSKV